jgi:hypothetical protein
MGGKKEYRQEIQIESVVVDRKAPGTCERFMGDVHRVRIKSVRL